MVYIHVYTDSWKLMWVRSNCASSSRVGEVSAQFDTVFTRGETVQEGLAVASIARDDPSTLPGDDPFPRARPHAR